MKNLLKQACKLFKMITLNGSQYAESIGVTLGKNCRIYIKKTWGTEPFLITIGNNVTVTSGVKFLTHDGATCLITNENGNRYQKYLPITVGDNVFIGVNSIIMPGVTIGSNVIVAAGSVVHKDISNNSVYGGVPAKKICNFSDYEQKVQKNFVNNDEINHLESYHERVITAVDLYAKRNS